MKRQRNTTQIKKKTRNTEVQINEEEVGKLPEKEFRIMIVKMIKNEEGGKDGRGIGREDHFLPHKFLKRTFQRRANSTKQLL